MGWSRISSIGVRVGKLLLVKCSQALSNWIKKSSLFCFWKFLCLVDLKICVYLKSARPWLEFRIKFNLYSMRSSQTALVGLLIFESILFIYLFILFHWISMSKIPSAPLQLKNWSRCLWDRIFYPFLRKSYILSLSFLIYFGIAYIWLMCYSLDKGIWFTITFLPLKESLTLFQTRTFLVYLHLFCPNWSYRR